MYFPDFGISFLCHIFSGLCSYNLLRRLWKWERHLYALRKFIIARGNRCLGGKSRNTMYSTARVACFACYVHKHIGFLLFQTLIIYCLVGKHFDSDKENIADMWGGCIVRRTHYDTVIMHNVMYVLYIYYLYINCIKYMYIYE